METKLVGDFSSVHGILESKSQLHRYKSEFFRWRAYWQILLVGENEEKSISKFVLVQHSLQLLTSLNDTIAIVAVNDEDDTLGVLEVMPPERSDLVLASHIPDSELDVLVLDSLNVKA